MICYINIIHCVFNTPGEFCEEENSLCQDQCENDGKCFQAYNKYVCICKPPAFGRHCEQIPDLCETEMPCSYGNCTSYPTNYSCECFPGIV